MNPRECTISGGPFIWASWTGCDSRSGALSPGPMAGLPFPLEDLRRQRERQWAKLECGKEWPMQGKVSR